MIPPTNTWRKRRTEQSLYREIVADMLKQNENMIKID